MSSTIAALVVAALILCAPACLSDTTATSLTETDATETQFRSLLSWWSPNIEVIIGGGLISAPRSRKYMAAIGVGPENDKSWVCGGSLISKRFVLSAAHCSRTHSMGSAKWVMLGNVQLSTLSDDHSTQLRTIVEIINHPDYNPKENYNDIALFKLNRNALFTSSVQPVCLHNRRDIPTKNSTLSGWGRTGFADGTSDKLLYAELDVFDDAECARLKNVTDVRNPYGIDLDTMMCAGKDDGSADGCPGDSGGPLVIEDSWSTCGFVQIGIASYGEMCSLPHSPGVYTRVSAYVPWIQEVLRQHQQLAALDEGDKEPNYIPL